MIRDLLSAILFFIWVGFIVTGINSKKKKTFYFVGTAWPAYFIWTPTKLIRVHWKGIDSFSREQFNGTINIVWDNTRWTLSFILKSRQSPYDFSSGNVDLYVVYTISMIDIENMFEIEKLCRMRIQEVMQKNKPQPLF